MVARAKDARTAKEKRISALARRFVGAKFRMSRRSDRGTYATSCAKQSQLHVATKMKSVADTTTTTTTFQSL